MSKLLANMNDDNLIKFLDEQDLVMWGLEGKWHVVNTRHLAFRIDAEEMEDDSDVWTLAAWLEEKFKTSSPQQGTTLILLHGEVKEGKHNAKGLIDNYFSNIPKTRGWVTNYLYANKMFRYRWVEFEKFNIFVNDDYLSLLYDTNLLDAYAEGAEKPLFLHGGDMMILPVKSEKNDAIANWLRDFGDMLKEAGVEVGG